MPVQKRRPCWIQWTTSFWSAQGSSGNWARSATARLTSRSTSDFIFERPPLLYWSSKSTGRRSGRERKSVQVRRRFAEIAGSRAGGHGTAGEPNHAPGLEGDGRREVCRPRRPGAHARARLYDGHDNAQPACAKGHPSGEGGATTAGPRVSLRNEP